MATRPLGDIADVWMQLALAEVIAVERPARYWETQAGPAAYAIERGASADRDAGVWHFHDHAARSPALAASQYGGLLREMMAVDEPRCPNSPLVAMRLLGHAAAGGGHGAHFLFCDTDPVSLTDITHHARLLDIPPARVDTREEEGADAVARAAGQLSPGDRPGVLVHVDAHRPPPAGLFAALATDGFKAVRGWAYDVDRDTSARLGDAVTAARRAGRNGWGGEITVIEPDGNVRNCGVLAANLSAESYDRCRTLGLAMAKVYPGGSFREL